MGSMTLDELRDAARWGLDNRTNITTTQLTRWANWTYLHITMPKIHRHQNLQGDSANLVTLVADQVTYDLPVLLSYTFWGIHSIWHIDGTNSADRTARRQRLKGGYDIRSVDESTLGQGRPTRYALWGMTASTTVPGPVLNLDRRPATAEVGQVLLIRGYRSPTLLSADGDRTILHPAWDEVMTLGMVWRGFRELREMARAEGAKADFVSMIQEQQEATKLDAEDWGGAFEVDLQHYMPVS